MSRTSKNRMKDRFESTIRSLNKCMHRYGEDLRANEALTRYALIDPLLVALGWNISDPDQVVPEYRPRDGRREAIDYRLMRDSFSMIIEAKALDKNLDYYEQELLDYVGLFQGEGIAIALCCLTNGDIWRIYEPHKPCENVNELSLSSNSLEHCIENLIGWKDLEFKYRKLNSSHEPLNGTIPMSRICAQDGLVIPKAIVFSNGEKRRLKAWKDVKQFAYERLEQKLPEDYNVRKRCHSSQVLKDTSRLLYYHDENPSETSLQFS